MSEDPDLGWARQSWVDPWEGARPGGIDQLWTPVEVSFYRLETLPDGYGGFESEPSTVTLWITMADVQRSEMLIPAGSVAGSAMRRTWEITTAGMPPDPDQMPRKGDWAAWRDEYGPHEQQLEDASDPLLADDHVEATSVAFE
jgi:hypothetical protein